MLHDLTWQNSLHGFSLPVRISVPVSTAFPTAHSGSRRDITRQAYVCWPQDPNSMGWVALNACLLIMFLVVIRFLTYVALRHKTSRK